MCQAGAVDCLQADVSRCGGILRPDPAAPGHGLTLRGADIEPYRVA